MDSWRLEVCSAGAPCLEGRVARASFSICVGEGSVVLRPKVEDEAGKGGKGQKVLEAEGRRQGE